MCPSSRELHDQLLGQWASDLKSIFGVEPEKRVHYHITNDSGTMDITQGEVDIYIEEENRINIFEVKRNYKRFNKAIKELRKSERYFKIKSKPVEKYIIIGDPRNEDADETGEMIYYLK